MSVQIDAVLAAAKKYVDAKYKEGLNNDTVFGKWYGLNHQPWCAMFVSKCFAEAKASKLIAAQTSKGFSSCQYGLSWFAGKKQLVPVTSAMPGDIVFYQFDSDPMADHVGIVVSNNKITKTLTTYEGNTAADRSGSQANGDGVYQKKRKYSQVIGVARPKWSK